MMPFKIYLAGPCCFRHDAASFGNSLRAMCAGAGFTGLFPADADVLAEIDQAVLRGDRGASIASLIFERDLEKLSECDGVIANLEPFRGPDADPGTCWEMGWAYGAGKPVWAYCEDQRPYNEKVESWNGAPLTHRDGQFWDKDNMMVDALGEKANLMMTRSLQDRIVHQHFGGALQAVTAYLKFVDDMEALNTIDL